MPSNLVTHDLERAAARRPLVVRCGAFGDVVLITALLAQLRARFGCAADVVSAGPWARPLLEGHPDVASVVTLSSRNAPYWFNRSQQRLVQWLRRRGAGPTWFCDANLSARALLTRAGIPDEFVCEGVKLAGQPNEHFTQRWIRFANSTPQAFVGRLPEAAYEVAPNAHLATPANSMTLEAWLAKRGLSNAPLIAIQAGNKRTMRPLLRKRATNTKYWPEENWAQVIRKLHELHPDCRILLLGVKAEWSLNEQIKTLTGVAQVCNVADDVPIPVLLPLLRRAVGMVSVDTGPAHAAAALGCPTVVLFGVADPVLFRPGGVTTPTVTLTGVVGGKRSMLGIHPDEVLGAWMSLVANRLNSGAARAHALAPGVAV